jgi:hypothetical protein
MRYLSCMVICLLAASSDLALRARALFASAVRLADIPSEDVAVVEEHGGAGADLIIELRSDRDAALPRYRQMVARSEMEAERWLVLDAEATERQLAEAMARALSAARGREL